MIGDIHASIVRMLCKAHDGTTILRLCPREGEGRLAWEAFRREAAGVGEDRG